MICEIEKLKDKEGNADHDSQIIAHCTIMFCTLKQQKQVLSGFTDEALDHMHNLISDFDDAVASAGMCKYQHVSEWYIVTCPRASGAAADAREQSEAYPPAYTIRMIELAHTLQRIAASRVTRSGERLELQAGLSAGRIASAFVGAERPTYCLYGNALNTAARLSKHACGAPIACAAVAADAATAGEGPARCLTSGVAALKGLGMVEIFRAEIDCCVVEAKPATQSTPGFRPSFDERETILSYCTAPVEQMKFVEFLLTNAPSIAEDEFTVIDGAVPQ